LRTCRDDNLGNICQGTSRPCTFVYFARGVCVTAESGVQRRFSHRCSGSLLHSSASHCTEIPGTRLLRYHPWHNTLNAPLVAPSNPTPAPPQGNSWSHPLTPPTCQQWKNWGKGDALIATGAGYAVKQYPATAPVAGPIFAVFGAASLLENGIAIAGGCFF
jgi:hypothetical protein